MTEKEYANVVAANLRRLAYEHNKTQKQIATDLQIGQSSVACWMNGLRTPKMPTIDKLAKYFNVSRNEIMEPYVPKPLESFTAFERNIILAYRDASEDRKESVLLLLGLRE